MRTLLLLLLGVLWGAVGMAQERPIQWLQRAQQAEETLHYAGVRTMELRVGRRTQRIEERFWRQGARAERIEILAPAERQGEVLILHEGRWLAYRPQSKEAFELPRLPLQGAQLLKTAIDLVQAGIVQADAPVEATLLGRPCVLVRLSLAPLDLERTPPKKRAPFPAAVSLWIDKQTGLILRSEVAMRPNEPALRMEITRLELNPRLAPDLFTLPSGVTVRPLSGEYRSLEDAQRAVGFPIRTPRYLPTGASLERILVRRAPPNQSPVVMLHYRAPNARFTLFQAYKLRHALFQHPRRPKPLSTRFWQDGDYSFGIVGNLSPDEIERIAKSLD